jgi:4-amino-4-deoxy-L-arabinose transferase-like glycosyltransferase
VSTTRRISQLSTRQRDALALLLILAVAVLYRCWQLTSTPPGLFGDEAVNGLDALDALAGRASLFYPANYGREGLAMLLFAGGIQLLGPTALALRLPAALAGIATALATYWLGREMLTDTRHRGALVPLLAALFLSTSFWHVYTSRYAERLIFTPLLAALAFAAFWRAANATQRSGPRAAWPWFLLAGLFLGLSVHFYSISRLLPVFLGIYLLLQAGYLWLARPVQSSASVVDPGQSLLRRAFWPLVGLYGVALLVFAPLGLYFLRHPGSFTQRAEVVSAFNPGLSSSETLAAIIQAGTANLLQFFVPGAGDSAPFFNLPGRAVFDPLTAALAVVGLILCLALTLAGLQRRRPAASGAQGARLLFLLLWFLVMLLPGWLAVDRFPALPRVMGVIPGVYFFPALALGELLLQARAKVRSNDSNRSRANGVARWLAASFVVLALVVHGGLSWRDYFQRWAHAADYLRRLRGGYRGRGRLAGQPPRPGGLPVGRSLPPSLLRLPAPADAAQPVLCLRRSAGSLLRRPRDAAFAAGRQPGALPVHGQRGARPDPGAGARLERLAVRARDRGRRGGAGRLSAGRRHRGSQPVPAGR